MAALAASCRTNPCGVPPLTEPACTLDAFLDGGFEVLQPVEGHRAGLDALLVAACVPRDQNGILADFGAGVGVAGLAAICSNDALKVDLIENAPGLVLLARKSIARPRNARIADRVRILNADILASARKRREAGILDERYDFVITNPPFNDRSFRKSPEGGKAAAHMMDGDLLEAWMRAMAASLKPGGRFTIILRPRSLAELLAATGSRFGGLVLKPVHSKSAASASRLLVGGIKGSRAALTIAQPLVVHTSGGSLSSEIQAISKGDGFIDLFEKPDSRQLETAAAREHLSASVE